MAGGQFRIREREREKPSSLSLSLRKQRVRVPNLSKSAAKFGEMEISVEKYPSPPFHSVGIRRDFSSRSPIFVSPMPMGHDFPRRESVGAEICVYTNESTESRFHGEEGSIGERERVRDGPFFRIDVSFLCSLRRHGKSRALHLSSRAFKSWKPERKSNFARGRGAVRVDRRGDDKDDARKKEKGRRGEGKPAFGKYRFIEEPESVALSDFHSTFDVCIIEP